MWFRVISLAKRKGNTADKEKPLKKCCNKKSEYLVFQTEANYGVCETHFDRFSINAKKILRISDEKIIFAKKNIGNFDSK